MHEARNRRRGGAGGALALALALALWAPAAGAESRGEQLFDLCSQCHGAAGGGDPLSEAPAIAGMAEWYVAAQLQKFRDGARGAHPDDSQGLKMRPMMRTLRSDEDLAAVAKHVAQLPPVTPPARIEGADPERGKTLYTTCIACHGLRGEGNQALNAPALTNVSDWYLVRQLAKFKAGVRGANPADTTGMLMRPMSMTLPDEQAMKDVIAYVTSLAGAE